MLHIPSAGLIVTPADVAVPLTVTARLAFDQHGHRLAGRFEAWCGDQLLVAATRIPFLDGCRALIAPGVDPGAIVVMKHAGSNVIALRAKIGIAAKFDVEESAHGPGSFRTAPPSAVDRAPVAPIAEALSLHPAAAGTAPERAA